MYSSIVSLLESTLKQGTADLLEGAVADASAWATENPYVAAVSVVLFVAWIGKACLGVYQRTSLALATRRRLSSQKHGVVYLHAFPRTRVGPQVSAPCFVVESFLRAARIPYVYLPSVDLGVSPTGRFPYIELNGVGTTDAHFIIERLRKEFPSEIEQRFAVPTESDAITTLFVRHFASSGLKNGFMRQVHVDNTEALVRPFRDFFPPWLPTAVFRVIFLRGFRKMIIDMLNTEGYGDLTDDQYAQDLQESLAAVDQLLRTRSGPGSFALGGAKPTTLDAHLFGWLSVVSLYASLPALRPVREGAIDTYLVFVRRHLFPDYDQLCTTGAKPAAFNGAPL